jgi:hypothetical protein
LNKDGIGKMLVYDDYTGIIGATIGHLLKSDMEIPDKICPGDSINDMFLDEYYMAIGAFAESKNESEID